MRPGIITLGAGATVQQAAQTMVSHEIHAVLVVGKGGTPLGWVTARGLLDWLERDAHLAAVPQAITEPVVHVTPSTALDEAARLLSQPGVSRLVVAHRPDDPPLGVIGELDMLVAIA